MVQCNLYNMEGREIGQLTLANEKWSIDPHVHVMHSALLRQLANRRAGTADTKTRGEVSGGGKKPWKQKGTGRARAGSNRSPLWKKGGVVFGPHPRDFGFELPRKVRRLALQSALSAKVRENKISAVEMMQFDKPKTSKIENFLSALKFSKDDTVLIVISRKDENVILSARNIRGVKVLLAQNLNVHDLLRHEYLLVTKDAISTIEEVFLG